MALDRRGKRTYFYNATWVNGRCVRKYVAAGTHANILWMLARLKEERRAEDRLKRRCRQQALTQEDRAFTQWLDARLKLARALIEAEGYHRPSRGRWRKKRPQMNDSELTQRQSQIPSEGQPSAFTKMRDSLAGLDLDARKRIFERIFLLGASQADFQAAALVLRETPQVCPDGLEPIAARLRSVLQGGLSAVVDRAAGESLTITPLFRDLLEADAARECEELAGGPDAPLAVRLLAQRVMACKFALGLAEEDVRAFLSKQESTPRAPSVDVSGHSISVALGDIGPLEKRRESAHRMYLGALKALTDAQRLPLPPVVQIAAPAASMVQLRVPALRRKSRPRSRPRTSEPSTGLSSSMIARGERNDNAT